LLRATLDFLALEPRAPELQLLHRCVDNWRGIGDVVTGMERQGYRLHLTVSLLPFRPARVHGVRPALEVIVLPAISGECRKSMKRWSPRIWRAETPAGFAARSSRCSRPRRCRRAKHALAEIRDDFHRIVYAASADAAHSAYAAFERTWGKQCPGVVTSLREGGGELLTFFTFPKTQWKTLRTTNTIERLHEEFRRRVKTQGSLPSEDAAVVLLFSLVASGQIKLRRIDGWRNIPAVLSQHTAVAA